MKKRLEYVLKVALNHKATDIHLTSRNDEFKIILRSNRWIEIKTSRNDDKLMSYLQYLSNMDIGNQMKPQTGQFQFEVMDKLLDLRFATMFSRGQTNGVLRILNPESSLTLEVLSQSISNKHLLKNLLSLDCGLILISGPTSSGKTTTLYTMLKESNKMVYTIEDPIEMFVDNFFQLEVNYQQGLTYATGIKQILRHDPDIIMIGEIRDEEAANNAIRAALTGHLVFATIHANDAVSTLYRLYELGVDEHLLLQSLCCVLNQRLIYDMNHQRRAIYEVMDQKKLSYFTIHKKLPRNHQTIQKLLEKNAIKDI